MVDIIHRVGIQAPLASVYAALATTEGVAGWWSRLASGVSSPGNIVTLVFHTPAGALLGEIKYEVTSLVTDKQVCWRFVAGPEEWIGTRASFDLYQEGDYTIVLFSHQDWQQPVEFMAHCSMKWATFLLSLKALAETGQGMPAPDDMKIDNWN